MKLFKMVMKKLYGIIFVIVISSGIISFLNVMMAKFIVYIVDGIVMNDAKLPNYLTMFFIMRILFLK